MPTAASEKSRLSSRPPVKAQGRTSRWVLEGDDRWLLVERIAESRSLGKSERLVDFLRYVSDRHIRGKDAEITEQQIGVRVFGRSEGYNSNDDNIVRNYARILRKRLEVYFRNEGGEEPMLVSIPRGGYVPVFEPRCASELDATPGFGELLSGTVVTSPAPLVFPIEPTLSSVSAGSQTQTPVENAPSSRFRLRFTVLTALPMLAVALLAGVFIGRGGPFYSLFQGSSARASRILWRSLFESDRDTYVVPADGGLVMLQSFTRHSVELPDYVNGSYRSTTEIERSVEHLLKTTDADDRAQLDRKIAVLAARRYTSIVDLNLASRLSRLREVSPERLVVRFARDFRIDDLRTGNAILIGSADANPWVSLFGQQLNFQFLHGNEFGGSETIVNTHPQAGEQASYASITGDPANRTYGVIAYVPNLEGTGHVLLIEGINMAGTQAAGDFLLNPEKMRPLLERALDSQGKLRSFEILLETTSVDANASGAKVLSERVKSS